MAVLSLKHERSMKLEDFENEKLLQFIEKDRGRVLSVGIAQLFIAKKEDKPQWTKNSTGIVCLVKSLNEKKHFFRLYNLVPSLIWQEEVTTNLYHKITANFHFYDATQVHVGLNFSFAEEAEKFYLAACRVRNRKLKPKRIITSEEAKITINVPKKLNFSGQKKAEKKKINKNNIGNPIGFVHVGHIGLLGDNSFDVSIAEQDENLKMVIDILKKMHIKPNKHTLKYADNFIQSNGGYSHFTNEYKKFVNKEKSAPRIPFVELDAYKTSPNVNNKNQNNYEITPNSLKPRVPPPKPPAPNYIKSYNNSLESTAIYSPNPDQNVEHFISPIPPNNTEKHKKEFFLTVPNNKQCFISPSPPPPPAPIMPNNSLADSSIGEALNYSSNSRHLNSSATTPNEGHSALLKSIENFKGGLRPIDSSSTKHNKSSSSIREENSENNLMTQLLKALGEMRPHLNDSSDEESSDSDSFD